MKFILQEDKIKLEENFLFDEKFILNEAPNNAINRADTGSSIEKVNEIVEQIKKFVSDITTKTVVDKVKNAATEYAGASIAGVGFNNKETLTAIKDHKEDLDAVIDCLSTEPLVNIDVYKNDAAVISQTGAALKKLLQGIVAHPDNIKNSVAEFKNTLSNIAADTGENKNGEKSQKEWRAAYESALNAGADELTAFWNDYYNKTYGKRTELVKSLGQAVRQEAIDKGFIESLNPFINYVKAIIDKGIIKDANKENGIKYGTIHNCFATKNETLVGADLKSDLLLNADLFKQDSDNINFFITKYSECKKDPEKLNKLFWAFFDGDDSKIDAASGNITENITAQNKIFRDIREIEASMKKVGIAINREVNFSAEASAKLIANKSGGNPKKAEELAKQVLSHMINAFAKSGDIANLRVKYKIDNNVKIDYNDVNIVKTIKETLRNTTIMPAELPEELENFAKASGLIKPQQTQPGQGAGN